ncbi:MAG: alpha-1,2-fucosyltransferase [bacterium]
MYSNESSTDPYYLPPTVATSKKIDLLEKMEGSNKDILFFSAINGGVFRNPDGIRKHHHKIVGIIAPTMSISKKVDSLLEPLRSKYAHVVGVHIRQSDYKTFKNGKYFVDQVRFVEILREYLRNYGKSAQEVGFVVASDGPVDLSLFYELNVTVSKNDVVTDLFTLASCNAVIGSDSTLSHFAAYYGDIPHVIAKNEVMDWNYYLNKKTYFPNKYLTIMLY